MLGRWRLLVRTNQVSMFLRERLAQVTGDIGSTSGHVTSSCEGETRHAGRPVCERRYVL